MADQRLEIKLEELEREQQATTEALKAAIGGVRSEQDRDDRRATGRSLMRIVTFGNCQAEAVASLLRRALPATGYSLDFYSNNDRTGDLRPELEILGAVREADLVVFQPLDESHGALSEASIRATMRNADSAISFPYAFNSGISSLSAIQLERTWEWLGHAPQNRQYPLGIAFGEDTIIGRLEQGASVETILDEYVEGSLDFGLLERFESCLVELERREKSMAIALSGHIRQNYRRKRQFLTFSHPATDLLVELCEQLRAITDLPIDLAALRGIEDENAAGLPGGRIHSPISPHDASILGYEFGHDPDWVERGGGLILRVAAAYARDREPSGSAEAPSPTMHPEPRRPDPEPMPGVATSLPVSPQKCVVIGNGPSLRGFDLARLSSIDTIGMNAAYRHWERIGWYPTHYACLDDEMIDTHHVEIARLIDAGLCKTAFLSGQFLFHHPEAADDDRFVFFDQFDRYWFEQRGSQFNLQNHIPADAFECTQLEFFEKMTTGSHAVRYAIWRGYTHIALIGIDLKYVQRIPESVAGEGIKLSIAKTPDHNPNYFFDDYQRAGDRFNVPNPDAHDGDLHVASFRALRDDLVAKDLRVHVLNANPASELSRQGVFPFQDLDAFIGVRALGAVVVPAVASSKSQVLANLEFWARPEAAPMLLPRTYKPDLIFSFNNDETGDALEPAISDAFQAHNLSRYFNALGFERLDLRGEADLYQTDYNQPVGAQGHKAGPNNQFFETMRRVGSAGRYAFYMEPDCVPIRPDWLGQLSDRLEHANAWIIGSVYRGRGTLSRPFMRHLNGNAIYAVGDAGFQNFLVDLEARFANLVSKDPRYAYDLALEILVTGASCHAEATEEERALWHYFQPIAHRFHPTDYIQNISAPIDVKEPDPALLANVRADSPGTYVIHNSVLARTLTA